jgi:catechol 2,3-dioxygenase-like lactoylglutathione lyase family enzyme
MEHRGRQPRQQRPQVVSAGRREFLKQSAALALVALHGELPGVVHRAPPRADAAERIRILGLTLQTGATLVAMKEFYHQTLGLSVVAYSDERLTIAAGATQLTFTPQRAAGPPPFYHFAFNIPENKIASAWEWQRSRVPLLPIPERLRDPKYPDDVVNYAHWDAHSIFFLDPGGNVVEYIARHALDNGRPGSFTSADILYASEIALVVDDVIAVSDGLKRDTSFRNYLRGGDSNFMALGDEHGLLLVMKRGRILNFKPESQDKAASVFPTIANVRGVPDRLAVAGYPYELTLAPA